MKPQLPFIPGLQQKIANPHYANVREHGAVGDGDADDTAAFEAAIAALPGRVRNPDLYGGNVYVPAGTYRLTRTLRLTSRINLAGEHSTRVRLKGVGLGSDPLLRADGEHIRIENLRIEAEGCAIEWHGGPGSSVTQAAVWGDDAAIRVGPGGEGLLRNLVVQGRKRGVVIERSGVLGFNGLTVIGTSGAGLTAAGGAPVTVQGMAYLGDGAAVAATDKACVAVVGLVAEGAGDAAVECDARSLVYAAAVTAPKYRLAVLDRGGTGAALKSPLGLYAGRAAAIRPPDDGRQPPLDEVRVDVGGMGEGTFAADFGCANSAPIYGDALSDRSVDFSFVTGEHAPRTVCLTERSARSVEYIFPMTRHAKGYTVRVHCCEIYHDAKEGWRVFDVRVNGRKIAVEADILKRTGKTFAPLVFEAKDVLVDQAGEVKVVAEGQANTSATIGAIEVLRQ